ncbi:mechanosensitive ion channel family protein [Mucilaginibacter sp. KACC 22063]|uniref:mechanosensitive ion channel family protein n=1 Tax=Mucilaginibacter sp. KACC 22063 TaxID=3025666 RepID=UPI002365A223|nr:mechanosensitive ion channel domain-containing protein [Mucilaginibacter sp. KACC 22063]WDF53499.1 mechanosensitive ion channel [Mucilaginibacter sp. KACC 22063]
MLKLFKYILILITVLSVSISFAQTKRRKHSASDSVRESILRRDSMMRTLKRSDTSLNTLLQKVEYYSNSFNQISVDLSKGFDTTEISQALPKYRKRVKLIDSLITKDKSNTLRYLYAIRDILTRTEDDLEDWQDKLADFNSKLVQIHGDLDQIKKDSTFHTIPADTSLQRTANEPIKAVLSKHRMLDSLNKNYLLKIGLMQNRLADIYIDVLDQKDRLNNKIRNFSERALSDEYDYIWEMTSGGTETFKSAVADTWNMNSKLLKFSLNRNSFLHVIGIFLFILLLVWIYGSRAKLFRVKTDPKETIGQTTYVALYPLLSVLIIVSTIQPFFYDHPPAVFLEFIFLINIVSVLLLVRKNFPVLYFRYLHILFWITVLYSISNLFVKASNADRVSLLILSVAAAVVTNRFIKQNKKLDDAPPYSRPILKIYLVLQVVAIICNITGRFSLSKIIAVTSTFNLWLAVSLFLFVQILMQGLFLQMEANKGDTGISSYLDYKLLQSKIRNLLYIAAVVLWVITLAQNLSVEDYMFDTLGDFLQQSRKVGGTLFTFGSILIFIIVIWLSILISRIISYFYDYVNEHRTVPQRKNRTSMLLIRLSIFAIGFFVAVSASGFPLDKITIILSAFGVGIGFGLQNIVNNLVSGLILAFEKPVEVGDIIEVSGKSGTIKEIGIRSSKIAIGNGAEVIVPNGDLISQHVTNWTLSNNNRQVDLTIGVAYGTDLEKVKNLLQDLLSNREDIMTAPAPAVLVDKLNESSVDFKVYFWAADISMWTKLKSSVLSEIYNKFNEAGIELPYPQRDIHLHMDKDAPIIINKTDPDPNP